MGSLRIDDVSVRIDGRALLDHVDLGLDDGASCVVMGPSGAGKSTLLRAVAGLVPYDGRITCGGRDLAGVALHRRGVGLLFQRPRLFPTMSALDNVAYPLRLRRVGRSRRRALAAELLAEVGLGDRADARSHELSGGEQQRVALARALCSGPEVLLLDEPLTGLDLPQRRALVGVLRRIQTDHELTWMVVTHDPDDAAVLGDTIAVLDHGRLVQHDTAEAVRTRPRSALVAALSANPNRLCGGLEDGRFFPSEPGTRFCVAGGGVSWSRTTRHRSVVRMTVGGFEHRGPQRVAVVHSPTGHLEVPMPPGGPEAVGPVDVWLDPEALWPIDDGGRVGAAREGPV